MRSPRADPGAPESAGADVPRLRVAFVNNYPMDLCRSWWQDGQIPGQLVWGGPQLERLGFEVLYVRHSRFGASRWLARLRGEFLGQQLRILRTRGLDVVYSGHFVNAIWLARLRKRGFLRVPLVCVVFMEIPPVVGRRVARADLGFDAYIALSPSLERHLTEQIGVPAERVRLIPWGADLEHYGPVQSPAERPRPLVVSAGKTDRDFPTLIAAAERLEADVRIFSDRRAVPDGIRSPPNVEIRVAEAGRFDLPYREFLPILRQASVVAIPVHDVSHMAGQTSLFEAMAAGRAVVMTRTRHIPFDIEAEGVGLWVEPGDARGFEVALRRLLSDRDEAEAMGARGRRLCEERYNIDRFARDVARLLREVSRGGP